MENNNKLCEAYTYFILPFYMEEECNENEIGIWEKAPLFSVEENIIYPYIQSFLQDRGRETARLKTIAQQQLIKKRAEKKIKENKSTPELKQQIAAAERLIEMNNEVIVQKPHNYQIYSIKESIYEDGIEQPEYITQQQRELNTKLQSWKLAKTLNYSIHDVSRKQDIRFVFPTNNQDFNSPKLIISPLAKVGFLMFCVKLDEKNYTLPDLTNMNYLLHKIGKGQEVACTTNSSTVAEQLTKLQHKIEKQTNEKAKEEMAKGLLKLQTQLSMADTLFSSKGNGQWTITDLLHFLLDDFALKVEYFNCSRFHLYTYYQLNSTDISSVIDQEQLMNDLTRITRCQNQKYKLEIEDVKAANLCMRTFQNIYIGSSVEGGAMMSILPAEELENPAFFSSFHSSSFSKRYIWIYMMVLIQRYTLLHLIQGLTQVDDDDLGISLSKLREKVEHLAEVKVNTYFTDISDFTQHNQYYQFCSRNLHIQEHFQEIDEKMEILNLAIKRREEMKEDRRTNRFTFLLALLTVASASKDGSDFARDYIWKNHTILGLLVIAALCLLVWFVWWRHEFSMWNIITRKEVSKKDKK